MQPVQFCICLDNQCAETHEEVPSSKLGCGSSRTILININRDAVTLKLKMKPKQSSVVNTDIDGQ